MKQTTNILNEFEAAILLRMSPELLRWFTSFAPKYHETRKLKYIENRCGILYFSKEDLLDFNKYLSLPWPSISFDKRPSIPEGIEYEIKSETKFKCAICNYTFGEIAHIDPVHNSKSNHPHNLKTQQNGRSGQNQNVLMYMDVEMDYLMLVYETISIVRKIGSLLKFLFCFDSLWSCSTCRRLISLGHVSVVL